MLKKVLLTGGTGFVGRAVLDRLCRDGLDIVSCSRAETINVPSGVMYLSVPGLDSNTVWKPALDGVEVVIHCAARVHVMHDTSSVPLAEFRKVNVEGTLNLARQAVRAGVKRFVYISSIKVNGEGTAPSKPYTADDTPMPVDPYGISKLEAEQGLQALSQGTGMEVVIIRPVLVYGPGVKANFLSMMNWLKRGAPLPLGAVHNKRSMVALDNLVDLVVTCIDHPKAANQVFLVSDGEDLSTTELLRRTGQFLGRPARLLPIPTFMLATAARLLGKHGIAQRLCGSLQVDIGKTRALLGWQPPVTVDEALAKTARHFLDQY